MFFPLSSHLPSFPPHLRLQWHIETLNDSLQAVAHQVTHVTVWPASGTWTAAASEQIVTPGCHSPTRPVLGNKMQSRRLVYIPPYHNPGPLAIPIHTMLAPAYSRLHCLHPFNFQLFQSQIQTIAQYRILWGQQNLLQPKQVHKHSFLALCISPEVLCKGIWI